VGYGSQDTRSPASQHGGQESPVCLTGYEETVPLSIGRGGQCDESDELDQDCLLVQLPPREMAELEDTLNEQTLGRVLAEDARDEELGGGNLLLDMDSIDCADLQGFMTSPTSSPKIEDMPRDGLEAGESESVDTLLIDRDPFGPRMISDEDMSAENFLVYTAQEKAEAEAEANRVLPPLFLARQRLCSNTDDINYFRMVCPAYGHARDRLTVGSSGWNTFFSPNGSVPWGDIDPPTIGDHVFGPRQEWCFLLPVSAAKYLSSRPYLRWLIWLLEDRYCVPTSS
jgi:hypothetical protein